MKDLDEYALMLGKFWGNFNSLELTLRIYLSEKYGEKVTGLDLHVGDKTPATHVTNYDQFGTLVRKYNAAVGDANRIDARELVTLRDAMAHGRVTTKRLDLPLTVIKFGLPDRKTKTVKVEFRQDLTHDYMSARIVQARALMEQVHKRTREEFGD